MTILTLSEDMRLDEIARDAYGSEGNGNPEAILAANPGLASAGLLLPAGLTIVLPDRPAASEATAPVVNPWD